MKTKIYTSNPREGWKEVQIPEKYRLYSYEALVKVVHRFVNVESCRGILITETPNPFGRVQNQQKRMSA